MDVYSIKYLLGIIVLYLGLCDAIKCFQCYRLHDIVIDNDRRECQDPFTGDGVHTFDCNTACIKDSTIFANGTSIVNNRGCKDLGLKCECDDDDNGENRRCCLECDDVNLCNASTRLVKMNLAGIVGAFIIDYIMF